MSKTESEAVSKAELEAVFEAELEAVPDTELEAVPDAESEAALESHILLFFLDSGKIRSMVTRLRRAFS